MGNRIKNLKEGLLLCQENLLLLATSQWKITQPLVHPDYDVSKHEYYVNFVADVSSELSPQNFHRLTQGIEKTIGHSSKRKWLPRRLDIDIVLSAKNCHRDFSLCPAIQVKVPNLTIPHPAYPKRDFLREMIEGDLGVETKKHFKKERLQSAKS